MARNRFDRSWGGSSDNVKRMVRAIKKIVGPSVDDIRSTMRDIANHGADMGVPGFTYYSETSAFYRQHEDAIWEMLDEMADDQGVTPIALVATFRIADTINTSAQFENALVWFALETVAQREVDE